MEWGTESTPLQETPPFLTRLPRLHRAGPSTSLDKSGSAYSILGGIILGFEDLSNALHKNLRLSPMCVDIGSWDSFQHDVDSSCMAIFLSIPMIQVEAFFSILGSSFPLGSIGGIIMAKLFHQRGIENTNETTELQAKNQRHPQHHCRYPVPRRRLSSVDRTKRHRLVVTDRRGDLRSRWLVGLVEVMMEAHLSPQTRTGGG